MKVWELVVVLHALVCNILDVRTSVSVFTDTLVQCTSGRKELKEGAAEGLRRRGLRRRIKEGAAEGVRS